MLPKISWKLKKSQLSGLKTASDIYVVMILSKKKNESYKMYTQEHNNKSVTKEFSDKDQENIW